MIDKHFEKEIESLISLLDEPDAGIYKNIHNQLISHGLQAIPQLEKAWENSFDELIRSRIESLIHSININSVYKNIKDWAETGGKELLQGFILVSKYQYPGLDEENILKQFGNIVQDYWLELNDNLTALEKIKVLNHIFFGVHKFKGNKQDFHNPKNFFINQVFETKSGSPISLSIIYSVLAQSLKVPVYGVNLPEHFILAYLDDRKKITNPLTTDVLFYINAFNNGTIFTYRELQLFLKQMKLQASPSYFQPCSNIEIIIRLLQNLITAYEKLDEEQKVEDLNYLLTALY